MIGHRVNTIEAADAGRPEQAQYRKKKDAAAAPRVSATMKPGAAIAMAVLSSNLTAFGIHVRKSDRVQALHCVR